jgi:E3 ubiquitin-protein ligase RGLG
MGCNASVEREIPTVVEPSKTFQDYKSKDELFDDMVKYGIIENVKLIIGIDATGSNRLTGRKTYEGRSLHDTSFNNPYLSVMRLLPNLFNMDLDHRVPLYLFGSREANKAGGLLYVKNCDSANDLISSYKNVIGTQTLYRPTTFVHLIDRAIQTYLETKSYQILIILTDGIVQNEKDNAQAITNASKYPISIIGIGVGDGPFNHMERFDNLIPKDRIFDNFQFVNYNRFILSDNIYKNFLFHAFMKVPRQYDAVKRLLGYIPDEQTEPVIQNYTQYASPQYEPPQYEPPQYAHQ